MACLLSIDLGTSSVKVAVVEENGRLLGLASQEYPIEQPQPGWAEQDPHGWWRATVRAARQAMAQEDNCPIAAIGLSGQMHGVVLVDAAGQPAGPAIIWADQRSAAEVVEMEALLGRARLVASAGTAPAAGFMGPTLLWLRRHDPARLEGAAAVLLPKDYLRLRLTGEIASEATDASSTALLDIKTRRWSQKIVERLGLPTALLPPLLEPADLAGQLLPAAARELGLPAGIPVTAGAADQAAQAVGNGLLQPGQGSLTVGSGGQVFLPLDRPQVDPALRIHTFCHAPAGRWYLLGAMLTAGLSLRWLRDLLGLASAGNAYQQLSALAAQTSPGADGLFFLPYLAGERSPLMDPQARGCFVGLTLRHGRGHLARAIMEGVAMALRQIVETMAGLGTAPERFLAVGNGMASPVWRQIAASVLDRSLSLPAGQEQTALGAALIAGIGAGLYRGYDEACQIVPPPVEVTEPLSAEAVFYDGHYRAFLQIYPALKDIFPRAALPPA